MAFDFGKILQTAGETALAIQRSNASGRSVRDYLTNPRDGIQTIAGANLAEVIRQYTQIRDSGGNSAAVIGATLQAIEQIRSSFENHVRSMGSLSLSQGGAGGIETINRVAATLTADRRAELAQLGGGGTTSEAGLNLSTDTLIWVVGAVVLLLLVFRR